MPGMILCARVLYLWFGGTRRVLWFRYAYRVDLFRFCPFLVGDGGRLVHFCLIHEGLVAFVLSLYGDRHAHVCKGFLEMDDVAIKEANATLAGAARHTALIVGATMNAYTSMPWGEQTQKPMPISQNVTTPIAKVVTPSAGILYLCNFKWLSRWRLRGLIVALALLCHLLRLRQHG